MKSKVVSNYLLTSENLAQSPERMLAQCQPNPPVLKKISSVVTSMAGILKASFQKPIKALSHSKYEY